MRKTVFLNTSLFSTAHVTPSGPSGHRRRRVAIGASVAVGTLVMELKSQGEDEAACRRAIDAMVRAGELQHTQGRKAVRRLA